MLKSKSLVMEFQIMSFIHLSNLNLDCFRKNNFNLIFKICFEIYIFYFSYLPVETWKEVFEFCNRKELGKGVSQANCRFNAISDPMMHEQMKHSLPSLPNLVMLNGPHLELPTTKMPKNIIAGKTTYVQIELVQSNLFNSNSISPTEKKLTLNKNLIGFFIKD